MEKLISKYSITVSIISVTVSLLLLFTFKTMLFEQFNYFKFENESIYYIAFFSIIFICFFGIYRIYFKYNLFKYILLVINVSLVSFYIFYTYKQYYYTDAVGYLLYAKEIISSGEYFPITYIYGDGIPIIDLSIYPLLLLSFINDLYLIHNLSMYLNFLVILISFFILFKVIELNNKTIILFYIVFTTGISGFISRHLFGEGGYGLQLSKIVLILSITIFLIKYGINYSINKLLLLFGVYFIWILQARIGFGLQYSKVVFLSLFIAMIILYTFEFKKFNPRNKIIYVTMLIVIIVAFFTGPNARNIIQGEQSYKYLEPRFEEVFEVNLTHIETQISILFGAISKLTDKYLYKDKSNFYKTLYYYKLFIFIIIWFSPIIILIYSLIKRMPNLLILSSFTLSYFAIIMGGFLISHVAYNDESARYLVVTTILNLTLFIIFLGNIRNINIGLLIATIVFSPFVLSSYLYLVLPYGEMMDDGSFVRNEHHLENFTNKIIDNDIEYAYATYWYSGVPTIFSNEKLKMRGISISSEGLIIPNLLGSSKNWYNPVYYQGQSCIFLLPHEYNKIDSRLMKSFLGEPSMKKIINSFRVDCYNFNIANKLPNWKL